MALRTRLVWLTALTATTTAFFAGRASISPDRAWRREPDAQEDRHESPPEARLAARGETRRAASVFPQSADGEQVATSVEATGAGDLLRVAEQAPDVGARLTALRAAVEAGAPSVRVIGPLLAILDEAVDAGWKIRALGLLSTLSPRAPAHDVLPVLRRLAADAGPALSIAALRAAAALEGDDAGAVDVLLGALSSEDGGVVTVAASLLGRFPGEADRVVPRLAEALLRSPAARSAAYASLRALLLAVPAARSTLADLAARAGEDAAPYVAALLGTGPAPDASD